MLIKTYYRDSRREKREKERETSFKDIIANFFPKLEKEKCICIQEAQSSKQEKHTKMYLIKMVKVKDKDNIEESFT